MANCTVHGCERSVDREGFKLCKTHWLAERTKALASCAKCGTLREIAVVECPVCVRTEGGVESSAAMLSSTRVGEAFDLSAQRVNLVLSELGWIEKFVKGWIPTEQGIAQGALKKFARQTGVPYVVWPATIVASPIVREAIDAMEGRTSAMPAPEAVEGKASPPIAEKGPAPGSDAIDTDFRNRHPAQLRAADGHLVRSRAEMLIDNWLYYQGLAHAYERRVPIADAEMYSDFYLPSKQVFIEFWGMESDARYAERKLKKIALYGKHSLRLIELRDSDITFLDDILPQKLLQFGIATQ